MTYTLADYAQAWFMNNSHGAVAYNRSTGRFGYSWRCDGYGQAYQIALSNCSGGEIVSWGQNVFLALAKGANGSWGTGINVSPKRAKREALRNCSQRGQNARIVLLLQTLQGVRELEQTPAAEPPIQQGDPHQIFLQRVGYGAFSVSPSSGLYSYATGQSSIETAQAAAVRNCRQAGARASDAVAVVSGFNTCLALARCNGVFGSAQSDDIHQARQGALQSVAGYGPDPEIVLVIHTIGGVKQTA